MKQLRRSRGAMHRIGVGAMVLLSLLPLRAAPPGGPVFPVEIPALIEGVPAGWLWASTDGLEVLSLASEDVMRAYVQNILEQRANLDVLLPRDLRITWDRPLAVILYGQENPEPNPPGLAPALSKSLTEVARERAVENREGKPLEIPVQTHVMPGAWAADPDSLMVFNVVPTKVRASELSGLPAPDFVSYLLDARSPPLPAWFKEGFISLLGRASVLGNELEIAPQVWISPAQSQLMLKKKAIPAEVYPIAELLAYTSAAVRPTEERRVRTLQSEAELLIRWVLDGRAPGGLDGLWKLLRGIQPGADLEALFTSSLGIKPEAATEELRAYLPTALRKPVRVRLPRDSRPGAVALRPATASEVARVKGEWERIAGRMVSSIHAGLLPFYFDQAQRSLASGPDDAHADPELLAARGLLTLERGEADAAMPLLEAACQSPTPRPRAVVELARLRLLRARTALPPGGKLDDATVSQVIAPLRGLLSSQPPMARVFQVWAECWSAAANPPAEADVALLLDAVRTVPNDVSAVIAVSRLLMDVGRHEQALGVIELGLSQASDDSARRRLFALRSAARAALPKTP